MFKYDNKDLEDEITQEDIIDTLKTVDYVGEIHALKIVGVVNAQCYADLLNHNNTLKHCVRNQLYKSIDEEELTSVILSNLETEVEQENNSLFEFEDDCNHCGVKSDNLLDLIHEGDEVGKLCETCGKCYNMHYAGLPLNLDHPETGDSIVPSEVYDTVQDLKGGDNE